MKHAAELKPTYREIGEAFLVYMCDVAGVRFEERADGWHWFHANHRFEVEPTWHGPFPSKGKAAVHISNYGGEPTWTA